MMAGERLNDIYPIGEILNLGHFMSERRARELPKIDIGGTMFYLDLRLNEFREVDNFMNRLDLNKLFETEGGYEFFYDRKTKNYFEGNEEAFKNLKDTDLIHVRLPTLQEMDPPGFRWLMQEFAEGSPITVRPQMSKAAREYKNNQLEMVLDKAGLLYRPRNHPPLLEKKTRVESNGKKL